MNNVEKSPRRRVRHLLRRVLILILVAYIAVLSFLYYFQTAMIFPGRATQGALSSVVHPIRGMELIQLTTRSGERTVAIYGGALDAKGQPLADAARRPTVLYFYGNGMCVNDCMSEFGNFRRLGFNVMIPEYVGYGMSTGAPSEAGCYESAEAAYQALLGRSDIDKNKIISAGWSLGSAVAIDLAARHQVYALAAFSGFTSVRDMGRNIYPFLPIPTFVVRHRFESERKIATVQSPIFIGHGKRDSLIPWSMSARLAHAAAGPVTLFYADEADHADFFDTGGKRFWQAFSNFINQIKN